MKRQIKSQCIDFGGSRPRGSLGYSDNAEELFARYESVTFEKVHQTVIDLYPVSPSQVLDIGAGSGRDAAALARYGHSVIAVDPSEELLHRARLAHRSKRIIWLKDSLPELSRVRCKERSFALIVLSAVWMHLDRDEQRMAMRRVADLLAPGGLLSISLRHGPVPRGRVMFDVDPADVCEQARENGLYCARSTSYVDPLGRGDIWWTSLALTAACG